MRPAERTLVVLAGVLLTSAVLLAPLCALAHRCGCTWPWAGAAAHCNVHRASGPHCPWCVHPALGAAAAIGIGGGQALVFLGLRRRRWSLVAAALVASSSFLLIGPLVTALLWLPTDYPHLFVPNARSRLGLPTSVD